MLTAEASVMPKTWTGTEENPSRSSCPLPSPPNWSSPQQKIVPLCRSAHERSLLATRAIGSFDGGVVEVVFTVDAVEGCVIGGVVVVECKVVVVVGGFAVVVGVAVVDVVASESGSAVEVVAFCAIAVVGVGGIPVIVVALSDVLCE